MDLKSLKASVGWSLQAESAAAGMEAAEKAAAQLSGVKSKLAIVFGSSFFDQPLLLEGVRSAVGAIPLIGGSTAGEITPQGPLTRSCVVLLLASNELFCGVGAGDHADQKPRQAGQQAAYNAAQQFSSNQRMGFLLFGDGLVSGYANVVRGIQEVLGTNALIAGGMTADDLRFSKTYQYANNKIMNRGIAGALLGGPVSMGVGLEHGFAPISKPRKITRASENVLYELDGQPAASVYVEYFGTEHVLRMGQERWSRRAIAYPLGIHHQASQQWLLRNVVAFKEDGSLTCSAEMLEDTWLQLMIGSRELALEAAYKAAQQAVKSLNRVACVLIFDSIARQILLGPAYAATEIQRIREAVGQSTVIAGCYTYGEQSSSGNASVYERTTIQTGSVLVVAIGS